MTHNATNLSKYSAGHKSHVNTLLLAGLVTGNSKEPIPYKLSKVQFLKQAFVAHYLVKY